MHQYQQEHMEVFHSDYVTPAEFCKVLEGEMTSLYLLAFLLTANHEDAEHCFSSTADAALEAQPVFKGWARSWLKRKLIKNAIQIVFPASDRPKERRDLWSADQPGSVGDSEIDAVAGLTALERFIFVMSVLERYSAWECALLLGCDRSMVAEVRRRALRGLAADASLPRVEGMSSKRLQATA
jgi:DNA-directed RNA polymerase specialized sigma24 family protein